MMELPLFIEKIFIFFAIIGVVLLCVYLISRPFKWFFKWVLNGIAGVLVLCLLHLFGASFGLDMPLNAITILVSALLGLPGVALILLKILFL